MVGMATLACAVFPMPLTISLLLGLMGGQNKSIASNCYWGSHRFHSIESDHAPYFRNLIHSHLVMKEASGKCQNDFVPAGIEIE